MRFCLFLTLLLSLSGVLFKPANVSAYDISNLIYGAARDMEFNMATGNATGPSPWSLATTDNDESVKNLFLPVMSNSMFTLSLGGDYYFDSFGNFATIADLKNAGSPWGGDMIVSFPHSLDTLDWSYGIGLRNPLGQLEFFIQLRGLGSSATVLDSALAQEAIQAGLWTSSDAYFEFDLNHAIFFATEFPPTGPHSFESSVLPEPAMMPLIAGVVASMFCRRGQRPRAS